VLVLMINEFRMVDVLTQNRWPIPFCGCDSATGRGSYDLSRMIAEEARWCSRPTIWRECSDNRIFGRTCQDPVEKLPLHGVV